MSGTPTLTNKRDHADLPVKPSLVEPVHDKTPPMFQGTFQLHVLVASGFQGTADPQLRKTFGENVIVTETRVRVSLCLDLLVSQYELEGQGSRPYSNRALATT